MTSRARPRQCALATSLAALVSASASGRSAGRMAEPELGGGAAGDEAHARRTSGRWRGHLRVVKHTVDARSRSTEAVCAGMDPALVSASTQLALRDDDESRDVDDEACTLDERRGAKPPRRGAEPSERARSASRGALRSAPRGLRLPPFVERARLIVAVARLVVVPKSELRRRRDERGVHASAHCLRRSRACVDSVSHDT